MLINSWTEVSGWTFSPTSLKMDHYSSSFFTKIIEYLKSCDLRPCHSILSTMVLACMLIILWSFHISPLLQWRLTPTLLTVLIWSVKKSWCCCRFMWGSGVCDWSHGGGMDMLSMQRCQSLRKSAVRLRSEDRIRVARDLGESWWGNGVYKWGLTGTVSSKS